MPWGPQWLWGHLTQLLPLWASYEFMPCLRGAAGDRSGLCGIPKVSLVELHVTGKPVLLGIHVMVGRVDSS